MKKNNFKLSCLALVSSLVLLSGCNDDNDSEIPNKNIAPVANSDQIELAFGKTDLFDVLSNDVDEDGDELRITKVEFNSNEVLLEIQESKIQVSADKVGSFTAKYFISDDRGGESSADIYITVLDESNDAISFVGSQTCLGCHNEMNSYLGTGHAHMLTEVKDNKVPEYPFSDITGALDFVEGLVNPTIEGGKPKGYEDISYVLGGFQLTTMWLDKEGYLLTGDKATAMLSDGYFSGADSIFPNPSPDGHPKEYPFCGQCHTTGWKAYTSLEGDERNKNRQLPGIGGTFVEPSVQCEACHGAGSKHVKNPSSETITKVAVSRTRAELKADDMAFGKPIACVECHTSIDSDFKTYPEYTSAYEKLFGGEHPANVMSVDTNPKTSGNGGSTAADNLIGYDPDTGEALGKMGQFHCTTCHNPHMSAQYKDRPGHETAVVECTSCHNNVQFNDVENPTAASVHQAMAKCTDCHMANDYHFFKIDISTVSNDAHNFSIDGKYRKPWLRPEEACAGCHKNDYDERALRIGKIHK